jgi:hypothetical protein
MKRLTTWCLQLTACFLLAAAATTQAQEKKTEKVDPTGTWTWSVPARDGGEARESTLKLKMEGDKLVGTISGRQGNETKITNAKMTGDELTFERTFERGGNSITTKYKGKIKGDTITGKITSERDGQSRENDWTAKRKKDEKKEEAKKTS